MFHFSQYLVALRRKIGINIIWHHVSIKFACYCSLFNPFYISNTSFASRVSLLFLLCCTMKTQHRIQDLPISIRLALVPIAMLSIYIIQLQTHVFTVFKSQVYQRWVMLCLYIIVGSTVLCLVVWDQMRVPLKFMYSCFFKRIGNHGNDQQSRLESFYQEQAESMQCFNIHKYMYMYPFPGKLTILP